jgi:hypothetical protein
MTRFVEKKKKRKKEKQQIRWNDPSKGAMTVQSFWGMTQFCSRAQFFGPCCKSHL